MVLCVYIFRAVLILKSSFTAERVLANLVFLLIIVHLYCVSVNSSANTFFSVLKLNVASYLQMICLTENVRTDVKDLVTLLTANACDIRKSILFLQFWIRSGGGILEERPLSYCRKLFRYKFLLRDSI